MIVPKNISSKISLVYKHIKANPKKTIAVIFAFVVVLFFFTRGDGIENTQETTRIPSVDVMSITALSYDNEPLRLLGEVKSVSQAELRTKKSGEVTQVYVTSGQYVPAGAILAEINNASERASVLSAQGVLASAQAQLDKIQAGARSEDKSTSIVQANAALTSLTATQDAARSAYSQAYSLAQNAIFAQADNFFANAYTVNPSFRVNSASYDEKQSLGKERFEIGKLLDIWKANTARTISNDELDVHLVQAQSDLERIKIFLNRIGVYISEQGISDTVTSTVKSSQEAVILGARSNIDSARTAINSARTSLANALSGAQVASLNESKTITGARSEDIASVEAQVTQARGALAGAYAQLENTLIRTPIRGTVSTFNVARGDFVSAMTTVALVANEGALEVVVFVSATSLERITVGDKALVDGRYDAKVTSVAPGLDPTTKKARVTIGLTNEVTLVNGAFVEVLILGAENDIDTPLELSVPITAIKVLPRGLAIFTVTDENTLSPVIIDEGPIVGNKMVLLGEVSPELQIVTDVRGFSEGDTVIVNNNDTE